MMRLLSLFFVLLPVILAAGCAAPAPKTAVSTLNAEFGAGTILSAETRAPVSYGEMLQELAESRIVYIGENHTDAVHHQIQRRLIEDLQTRHPSASVGMEMIDHTYQPVLDRWIQGELSEKEFIERTHWYANWRYDFGLYRPVFEIVRDRHIPLFGLNLPFHIPPKIACGGLSSLMPEDAGHLPQSITLTDPEHRAYVEAVFNMHHFKGRDNFEYFYEAQCTWEDTMAEAVAVHKAHRPMIVLAGIGHIVHKFGIPNRAFRRTRESFKTVCLVPAGRDVDLSDGDFIWITGTDQTEGSGNTSADF